MRRFMEREEYGANREKVKAATFPALCIASLWPISRLSWNCGTYFQSMLKTSQVFLLNCLKVFFLNEKQNNPHLAIMVVYGIRAPQAILSNEKMGLRITNALVFILWGDNFEFQDNKRLTGVDSRGKKRKEIEMHIECFRSFAARQREVWWGK